MKNPEFLKAKLIANKGIYNNQDIYENTLESFKLAIEKQMALYLKINITKDGVLVIYDDQDLTRLMNLKDKINMTTYEELSYLCSYHIPTLAEVLDLVRGSVPLIINPQFKKEVLPSLTKFLDEYPGKFAIVNPEATIIKWFNKNRPDYLVGEMITKRKSFTLGNYFAHYSIITDFKSIKVDDFNLTKIHELKKDNLIIGYLIDNQTKYHDYHDLCDSLYLDNIHELTLSD